MNRESSKPANPTLHYKGGDTYNKPIQTISLRRENYLLARESHCTLALRLVVAVNFGPLIQLVKKQGFVFADFFRCHAA